MHYDKDAEVLKAVKKKSFVTHKENKVSDQSQILNGGLFDDF